MVNLKNLKLRNLGTTCKANMILIDSLVKCDLISIDIFGMQLVERNHD
jgi:hypothetical protein